MTRLVRESIQLAGLHGWHLRLAILLAVLVLWAPLAHSTQADDGFIEDAEAAVAQAVKEKKDLLILFTGSDWCPPCMKLEQEVFSKQDFLDGAAKDFVLLKLDYPKRTPQDDAIKQQNAEWADRFGVGSFPTVIMTDAKLLPFKFAGYEEGGPENYLRVLSEAKQLRELRDQKFAESSKVTGDARAKLIDEALTEIGEEIVGVYYTDWVEKLVVIDNDNRLGLRQKWNGAADAEMRKIVITDVLLISRIGKPEKAIEFIDEVLQQIAFSNTEKLTLLQIKLNLTKTLKDPDRISMVLDEMIELDGVVGQTKHRLIAKKAYLMVGANRRDDAIALLDAGIQQDAKAAYLYLAKGQLLASEQKHAEAIRQLDLGLEQVVQNPDLEIELLTSKADSLFATKQPELAVQVLDDFSENENRPAELRSEALLQKAMLMREMGRTRQAMLTENRAISLSESPNERSSMQKIVEQLRKTDR